MRSKPDEDSTGFSFIEPTRLHPHRSDTRLAQSIRCSGFRWTLRTLRHRTLRGLHCRVNSNSPLRSTPRTNEKSTTCSNEGESAEPASPTRAWLATPACDLPAGTRPAATPAAVSHMNCDASENVSLEDHPSATILRQRYGTINEPTRTSDGSSQWPNAFGVQTSTACAPPLLRVAPGANAKVSMRS